jgi:hypothetical protein
LVRQFDTIDHEDGQLANKVTHHDRATSLGDAGWSGFVSVRSFQAVEAGQTVGAVPAAYTSQACWGCGGLVVTVCPSAGTSTRTVGPVCIGTTTRPAPSCDSVDRQVRPGRPFRRQRSPLGHT